MTDTADLNLVLALVKSDDALKARAEAHLARHRPLVVPYPVGIELLFVSHRFGLGHVSALGATEAHFELEGRDVLYTAAEALDTGDVRTVFDALHCADALHRQGSLHTADQELVRSPFPTVAY